MPERDAWRVQRNLSWVEQTNVDNQKFIELPHLGQISEETWKRSWLAITAGVNMNLSEIFGSLKRDWKEKKSWNTTRQLPDPATAPQVVGQLFGAYLPIYNFKL